MAEQEPHQSELGPRESYLYLDTRRETGGPTPVDERSLNERAPLPQPLPDGSRFASRREVLDSRYGPEETNLTQPQGTWFFDTEPFADRNELSRIGIEVQGEVVNEAWQNLVNGEGYTLEGKDMTGRLKRRAHEPDMGYVRVSPEAQAAYLDAQQHDQE